ncbi:MAG: flagellar motor switch protein FliG, partial [Spirochaetales bacterium]
MAKQSASSGLVGGKKGGLKKELTGRQKAAIFLVTVGSEISAEIFKHLREDEIETLTF